MHHTYTYDQRLLSHTYYSRHAEDKHVGDKIDRPIVDGRSKIVSHLVLLLLDEYEWVLMCPSEGVVLAAYLAQPLVTAALLLRV